MNVLFAAAALAAAASGATAETLSIKVEDRPAISVEIKDPSVISVSWYEDADRARAVYAAILACGFVDVSLEFEDGFGYVIAQHPTGDGCVEGARM